MTGLADWIAQHRLVFALMSVLLSGCAADPEATPPAEAPDGVPVPAAMEVRDTPVVPIAFAERLARYQNARQAIGWGWADGAVVAGTRFGETQQLIRVNHPMGAREQLTFAQEPVAEAFTQPVPEPTGLVYQMDVGGSEFYQLFWMDFATGQSTQITQTGSRNQTVVWHARGDRFAYATTVRNGRSWDLHEYRLDGTSRVLFERDEGYWIPLDYSPDGDRLLVLDYRSSNDMDLYELSIADGTLHNMLQSTAEVAFGGARYSADGAGVYFTADAGAEFMRLHHLQRNTGKLEVLTSEIAADIEEFALSPDGTMLAFTANEQGYSRLYMWSLPERRHIALPELPQGVIQAPLFNPASEAGELAFTLFRAVAPADVYSVDVASRALRRWTASETGGLHPNRMVDAELVEFPTFDAVDGVQRRIPAFVYRPQIATDSAVPVVVLIHGGPAAQYRPRFSATVQSLVNELGVAVVAPNVRGSAGYGKTYLKIDDGYLREDSVRDIGALLDWIATQPDLDAQRIAVMGGSYGGYMVLAAMVHYGDRLAAAVETVGISNFVTFLENTQGYRRDIRRTEYGDERDPDMRAFLERISPLNHVEKMRNPLLIAQGNNDPRVPASESEQIYTALRNSQVPVWYLLAMDEGHGFRKKVNVDYYAAVRLAFLQRYLVGTSQAEATQ